MDNYENILIFLILIGIIIIFAHIYYIYNCKSNEKDFKAGTIDEKYTRILKDIIRLNI
jgi:hypothetical protein